MAEASKYHPSGLVKKYGDKCRLILEGTGFVANTQPVNIKYPETGAATGTWTGTFLYVWTVNNVTYGLAAMTCTLWPVTDKDDAKPADAKPADAKPAGGAEAGVEVNAYSLSKCRVTVGDPTTNPPTKVFDIDLYDA